MTREGFARAYESGHGKTVKFLVSRGFPEEIAEETAQAAWVRGWERKEQLRDVQKTLPWVNSIAFNMGRSATRRQIRYEELPEQIAVLPSDPVAGIDIHRKLGECSDVERALLERRYLREWSIPELAKSEHCTPGAMRIRLLRARQHLRQLFDA
jgi:DNA-directed RNA polymerase specialized sigma24 family protein